MYYEDLIYQGILDRVRDAISYGENASHCHGEINGIENILLVTHGESRSEHLVVVARIKSPVFGGFIQRIIWVHSWVEDSTWEEPGDEGVDVLSFETIGEFRKAIDQKGKVPYWAKGIFPNE